MTNKSETILKIVFVLCVAVIFFIGGITFKHIDDLSDSTNLVNHTYEVSIDLEKLYIQIKDLETTKRDYVLTKDETVRFSINILKKNILEAEKKLRVKTKDNKKQLENYTKLEKLIAQKFAIVDNAVKFANTNNNSIEIITDNLLSGKRVMNEIQDQINDMIDIEKKLLHKRHINYESREKFTPLFIYLALLLTLVMLTIAYFKMSSAITELTKKNNLLSLSNESNGLAEEIGKFGIWKWDIENNQYTYSDNIYRLLGYEPKGMPSTLEAFMDRIHPEDLETVNTVVAKMIHDKKFHPFSYRIIRADNNEIRYLYANNRLFKDNQGKEYLLGTTSDITSEVEKNKLILNKNQELESKNEQLILANEIRKQGEEIGKFGNWQWETKVNRLYFSDNLYKLLGQEPHSFEPSFDNFFKYIHPEDLNIVKDSINKMLVNGELPTFNYRVITQEGRIIYVKTLGKTILKEKDNIITIGTTIDITDEVIKNISLEERNRALVEFNNEIQIANKALEFGEEIGKFGNWQWDIVEDKWYFSDNLYRILGEKPGEFEANLDNFFKYIHPEDVDYVKQKAKEMAEIENLPSFTYRIIRKSGETIHVKSLGRPFSDDSGIKILAGCTVDITEEVNNRKDVEEQNRILEANNKELQAFNYVASHDLQEPLRKIETFISRLIDQDHSNLSESGQQYVTRIKASASRMRVLIDDLLQFSRTTRTEQVFEKTDLNVLLENSKLELAQAIEDKKAKIINDTLPEMRVIPFQIQQLFTNLIGNSIKYSKTNESPVITINIETVIAEKESGLNLNSKDKYFKIIFKDNGIGFDNEYANKIFELFSRLHGKNEYEGTGIGLAICKKIIENHKGFIYASGIRNSGSTFTIYLPKE